MTTKVPLDLVDLIGGEEFLNDLNQLPENTLATERAVRLARESVTPKDDLFAWLFGEEFAADFRKTQRKEQLRKALPVLDMIANGKNAEAGVARLVACCIRKALAR